MKSHLVTHPSSRTAIPAISAWGSLVVVSYALAAAGCALTPITSKAAVLPCILIPERDVLRWVLAHLQFSQMSVVISRLTKIVVTVSVLRRTRIQLLSETAEDLPFALTSVNAWLRFFVATLGFGNAPVAHLPHLRRHRRFSRPERALGFAVEQPCLQIE